jgi:hypothetical protein
MAPYPGAVDELPRSSSPTAHYDHIVQSEDSAWSIMSVSSMTTWIHDDWNWTRAFFFIISHLRMQLQLDVVVVSKMSILSRHHAKSL